MINLSIIIPVRNGQETISNLLSSVYNTALNRGDFEVIIVDNNSTDNTLKTVYEFQKNYENIKIIKLNENIHCGGGRNRGIAIAEGTYIVFADADDEFTPGLPKVLHYALELNPDMYFATALQSNISGEWHRRGLSSSVPEDTLMTGIEFLEKYMEPIYWHPAWGVLFRRSFLLETNYPFVESRCSQDCDWKAWHIYKSKKIAYTAETIYKYIYNTSSVVHRKINAGRIADNAHCAMRREKLSKVIKDECPRFSHFLWDDEQKKAYIENTISLRLWREFQIEDINAFYRKIGKECLAYQKENYRGELFPMITFRSKYLVIIFVYIAKSIYKLGTPIKHKFKGIVKSIRYPK